MPVLFTKLLQSARKQHKKRSVNRITYIDTCRYVKQVYCRYNSKSWQDRYLFHLITHEKNFLFISALIWFAAEWMLVSCCKCVRCCWFVYPFNCLWNEQHIWFSTTENFCSNFAVFDNDQGTDGKTLQDAQLSQRDRAAGCVILFAKSRTLELGDNDLRTL